VVCEPNVTIEGCNKVLTKTEMNGVSMVSVSERIDASNYTPVNNVNATWAAIIPFGFVRNGASAVEYNISWQWYGEKRQGTIESIALAKSKGLKVLLKPHLWIMGSWVGDLDFNTEADWLNFESTYKDYIMDFASLADSMGVEAYSVGVELKKSVVQRASYWETLIDSVKTVYSGKLTYAANWDNYENVTFWSKLDYIGIDAYFPVSEEQTPSFESCYDGWESDFEKIKSKSITENKKVIFTEFGYRNVDFAGKEPWDANGNTTFNSEGQENAYKAIFCRFWSEPWFEGGFLWKWYPNHASAGGAENNRFTPQNKPVEEIIKSIYGHTNQ
ncbi:MAG: glycoside hydrolase, partial [Flavobacteriales bacterium]